MVTKYTSGNILLNFCLELGNALNAYHDGNLNSYEEIDQILLLMLKNNAHPYDDEKPIISKTLEYENDIRVVLVEGVYGSKSLPYFDYIDFYGMRYLVIFLDVFKSFQTEFINEEDLDSSKPEEYIDKLQKINVGNNEQFTALVAIGRAFVELMFGNIISSPSFQFSSTGVVAMYYPYILAGWICNSFRQLTEADVSGIELEDVVDKIENIALTTIGIWKLESDNSDNMSSD